MLELVGPSLLDTDISIYLFFLFKVKLIPLLAGSADAANQNNNKEYEDSRSTKDHERHLQVTELIFTLSCIEALFELLVPERNTGSAFFLQCSVKLFKSFIVLSVEVGARHKQFAVADDWVCGDSVVIF